MAYQLINETTILRLKDGAFIPADEANPDYREYQKWLGIKKNKPLPPPSLPEPAALTAEQKLLAAGLTMEDLRALLSEAAAGIASPSVLPEPAGQDTEPPPAERIGQVWTAADGTSWVVIQARGEDGQFLGDDPATDERENLRWVQAPASTEQSPAG